MTRSPGTYPTVPTYDEWVSEGAPAGVPHRERVVSAHEHNWYFDRYNGEYICVVCYGRKPPRGFISPLAAIGEPPQHFDRSKRFGPALFPKIGRDVVIEKFASVDSGTVRHTEVGDRCYLMCSVNIGHDAILKDDVKVAANAVVAGHCELGRGVKVGIGAMILPYRKVGAGSVIGAGAVITVKEIPAGEVWAGNPARFLRKVTLL